MIFFSFCVTLIQRRRGSTRSKVTAEGTKNIYRKKGHGKVRDFRNPTHSVFARFHIEWKLHKVENLRESIVREGKDDAVERKTCGGKKKLRLPTP